MGITVADNFKHLSKKFLDDRESFDTLADMKAASDASIPEGFETYCKATDKRYKFLSTNAVDTNTGKWREVEYGGGGTSDYTDLENKPQIEGVTLTGNKTASDLGLAKANQIPTVPTKVSQLQNDSGFITNSALPGVYAGNTAGLVPAAGSGNAGKFLGNDGSWETPPMPMIGTINRSDIYDTTEKVVGKWTDGRPLYQKVLTGTLTGCGTQGTTVSTSIAVGTTVNHFVDVHIFVKKSDNGAYQKVNVLRQASSAVIGISATCFDNTASSSSRNKITIDNSWFAVDTTYYIIVHYTKTTDAANSYNYADENDYSTSEKIIGKWIDGKTLYQKTIQTTMPTVTTDGVEANGAIILVDANIDRFISAVGTVRYENNDLFLPETRLKDTSDPSKGCYTMRIACITGAHQTAAYRGTFMIKSNHATVNGCTAYVTLKYTKTS